MQIKMSAIFLVFLFWPLSPITFLITSIRTSSWSDEFFFSDEIFVFLNVSVYVGNW